MGDDSDAMDEGDFAIEVAEILRHTEFVGRQGWEINGLDIGEIEIRTGDGEQFRLIVERIAASGEDRECTQGPVS